MASIMLDLETMSTKPNAAIVAVGAVAFTYEEGIIDTFYNAVDLQSSLNEGLEVCGDTVMWWVEQTNEAKKALREDTFPLWLALNEFSIFCAANHIEEMWGNGAAFDNVILENAYRAIGSSPPWRYDQNRCYRTVAALHKSRGIDKPRPFVSHHAMYDAKAQAQHLIALMN